MYAWNGRPYVGPADDRLPAGFPVSKGPHTDAQLAN